MNLIKFLLIAVFAVTVFAAEEVKDNAVQNNVAKSADVDLSKVAAFVNGKSIAMDEVNNLAEMTLSRYPENMRAAQEKVVKKRVLDTLIFGELVEAKAKELKIEVSLEQCEKEITDMVSSRGINLEDYKKMLVEAGKDYNELVGQVRKSLEFDAIIEKLSGDKTKVSDEDVQKYFDENKAQMAQPEEVRASHILVKVDADSDKAAAKAKIDDIAAKLKDGGDFAALAKEYSDCPSSARGGDLDFFSRGRMVKEFEDAAYGMEVGDVSDVVETQFGYHIILVTDKHEAKEANFDEVKEDIKNYLQNQKKSELAEGIREDMMKVAKISYSDVFKPEEPKIEGTEIKVDAAK
ncbi:MAG: peptidylprolyl isomerase [Phycisphaerae bacterium]|jgi:peptidyl-prolyl cis-trans isomerase C